ncbi:hypothetical protein SAMN05414139_07097 [Burkholderia sp. D7]|nr:hypothetical protein SAMN05414139_07097 [Burkholderia sp. D7]
MRRLTAAVLFSRGSRLFATGDRSPGKHTFKIKPPACELHPNSR